MTTTNDFFNRLEGVWQNKLDGQWQDDFGWNFISQPQLGQPGGSDFEMRFDQMHETITFDDLGRPSARNIGITGEAGFWHAMSYQVSIETPDREGIHHEMGHFLLSVLKDGETQEDFRGDIVRQASIPRANSMMTTGVLEPGTVAKTIAEQNTPFYNARPQTKNQDLQDKIDAEFAVKQKSVTALGGPDLTQPLKWLETKLPDTPEDAEPDWVFGFRHDNNPSQMAHGQRVVNPVAIGNLLSDFWIEEREINGNKFDVLQYAQKVDLIFHGIEWPHIALNTLIKQP